MTDYVSLMRAPTVDTQAFWDGCQEGKLLVNRCEICSRYSYFPRLHCPFCGHADVRPTAVSGDGSIYSFTTVRFSPFGDRWKSEIPYVVAQVDLDEGVRFLSRVIAPEIGQRIAIGCRVRVHFVNVHDSEMLLPFFQLTPPQAT